MNIGRIFTLPRAARLRHLMHQPFAGGVLAVCQLQRISHRGQPGRQPERQRHRHRATVTLERNQRPAERLQHMPFNSGFKMIAMRCDDPARICRSFNKFLWNGVAGKPCLHGAIVDGIRHTQDRRRRISRVPERATRLQAGAASRLVIAVQNALFDGGEFGAGFRHGWPSLDGRPGCAGTLAGISKRRSTAS